MLPRDEDEPRARAVEARSPRAISALIGLGGQATEQPIRNPDRSSGRISTAFMRRRTL
jgi:hypothetical protein